ncbi:MAG: choice-of-anchor I family protein [Flaviflexus sp.]|nr:choice-of-anchor I family protein [Flaviflexus sp.]
MSARRIAQACAAAVMASMIAVPASAESFEPVKDLADETTIDIDPVGTYHAGLWGKSAAEIVAYHPGSKRIFTVNAEAGAVDILDASDPSSPTKVGVIEAAGAAVSDGSTIAPGAPINSVSMRPDGLGVAAVENPVSTDPGYLLFFNAATGENLGAVPAGAMPDMVKISHDGQWAVSANEGEPADDYSVDPEGSLTVVELPATVRLPDAARQVDFHAFEGAELPGVRIFGGREDAATGTPKFPVSENLEPEYVTIEGTTAYVSLQENNAIATVDLAAGEVTDISSLGTVSGMDVAFDISNKDDEINRINIPVNYLRQPDSIASVNINGTTYILTANEGDARDYDAYSEEARIKDLGDEAPGLCEDNPLRDVLDYDKKSVAGRLKITLADGYDAERDCYAATYAYGTRSMTIFTEDFEVVFDTGEEFEALTERVLPEAFNSNGTTDSFDSRSDDKGPEPEGLTVGTVGSHTYAFIGFERIGGIAIYDITDPAAPTYQAYINNRDFSVDPETDLAAAGDVGPEGLAFVPADESADGTPWLIVGNEMTGTTTIYSLTDLDPQPAEPTEPAEPAEPTDPAEPTEPAAPTSPAEPSGEPTAQPSTPPGSAEPTVDPTVEPTDPTTPSRQEPSRETTGVPSSQPSPTSTAKPGSLARTGAPVGFLIAWGGAAIIAGTLLIRRARMS